MANRSTLLNTNTGNLGSPSSAPSQNHTLGTQSGGMELHGHSSSDENGIKNSCFFATYVVDQNALNDPDVEPLVLNIDVGEMIAHWEVHGMPPQECSAHITRNLIRVALASAGFGGLPGSDPDFPHAPILPGITPAVSDRLDSDGLTKEEAATHNVVVGEHVDMCRGCDQFFARQALGQH
ncbi:hypothetical protein FRC01_012964 [Tulasnella sp. 417]|nr:hypothetical protein FRC01_012964 [Tulasnella sp. 417]